MLTVIKPQDNLHRFHFSAAGVLGEGSFYIERAADHELYEALLRGEYCYLLAPPRTGKSSLRVRVAQRLMHKNVRCATIDLSKMDTAVSEEGFYYALIVQLAERLGPGDPTAFYERNRRFGPAQRWAAYLRDELMPVIQQRVVVFIDEVDAVRALRGGADQFFAVLRGLFADRDDHPDAARLTVCLIGSAAPDDLVRDPGLIPLDIARLIELSDFTQREAEGFLPGLAGLEATPERVLDKILTWTDGHPFMTQQLCEALLKESGAFGTIEERIDRLVGQHYLESGGAGGPVLAAAQKRFEEGPDSARLQALSLYRRLLFGERVPAQREDRVQLRLRFAGLIKQRRDEDGHRWLQIRNRVFERVLGPAWIAAKAQDRQLASVVTRWLLSGKDPAQVLRGQELDEALKWARPGSNLSKDEEEFLRAALAVRQEEELRVSQQALEEERRLRQVEQGQRRREQKVIAAVAAGLSLCTLLGVWALLARARRAADAERAARSEAAEQARQAQAQAERAARAREVLEYAAGRLSEAAGEPWPVRGWLPLGNKADTLGQIDGLATLALARQADSQVPALLSALRAAARYRGSASGATPPLLMTRALYGAVAESLAAPARDLPEGPGRSASADRRGGAPDWAVLQGHTGVIRGLALRRDGQGGTIVITGSDDTTARIWEARTGRLRAVLTGHGDIVRGVALSPDAALAATASHDHTVRLWRTSDGRQEAVLRGHSAEVPSVAFSPDGKLLLTASGDGSARLWTVPGGQAVQVLRGHPQGLTGAGFSPDGRLVLTTGQDGTAVLWSVADGKLLHILRGHHGAITAAAFSPAGDAVLTGGGDHTARIWDLTGRARHVLQHPDGVTAASFSPDGRLVLTAGQDGVARLWSAERGELVRELRGHGGPLTAVAFSPDGGRVLSAGQDRTARLWDRDGNLLAVLKAHGHAIWAATFSPDGGQVVTAGGDRTARVYPATLPGFYSAACRLLAHHPEPGRPPVPGC